MSLKTKNIKIILLHMNITNKKECIKGKVEYSLSTFNKKRNIFIDKLFQY
jgi:hypothetical protein